MGSLAALTDHYLRREEEFRTLKAQYEEAMGNLGTARTLLKEASERFAITEYFHNGRFVRIDKGIPRLIDKLIHNSTEITWPDPPADRRPVCDEPEDDGQPSDDEVSELVADLRKTAASIAHADNEIG